jgi:hypothetical protein
VSHKNMMNTTDGLLDYLTGFDRDNIAIHAAQAKFYSEAIRGR